MGVSRQVKAEAEHVFHNDNLFVLVTRNLELGSDFRQLIEPFILTRDKVARSFKHHAITLDLDFSQYVSLLPQYRRLDPPISFMIAGEDMPWLVRTLGIIDGIQENDRRPLLQHSSLSISAVGPLEVATTRENGRPQDYNRLRKILEPLHHLHGIQQACLDATVSAEYKHRILESIHKPRLGLQASVDEASTFVRTGDEAFRCGRHLQAIHAYQEALDCLQFFYGLREPWFLESEYFFGETLTELFFNLFNRQRAARIRLEIGRKGLELAHFAQSGANRLDESVRAGIDYAVGHFSNFSGVNARISSYWQERIGLDVQLDIIHDFESEPCMKKAVKTLRVSLKDDHDKSTYMNQLLFGLWDGWILEI